MSTRRRKAISSGVLLLVICVVAFGWFALRPREMRVAVFFDGYTNDSRGTLLARLQLVNRGTAAIKLERGYVVETQRKAKSYPDTRFLDPGLDFFHRNALLVPGESEAFEIPAITDQGAWRVAFSCFPWGLKMLAWERMGPMRMNEPAWKMGLYRWVSPTYSPVHSKWIEAHDADQSGQARQIFPQDTLDQRMNDRSTWIDVGAAKNF